MGGESKTPKSLVKVLSHLAIDRRVDLVSAYLLLPGKLHIHWPLGRGRGGVNTTDNPA